MVSQKKLEELDSPGYKYIVGVKLNQWKEVKEDVLTTRGRFTKVKDNMLVKEVLSYV